MKKIADEEILAALMQYGTIKQAAAATGAGVRTIYDRMHDREFKALYEAARADVLRGAVSSLSGRIEKAVSTIEAIMDDTEAAAAVRLQAAGAILCNVEKFAGRLSDAEAKLRPTKEPTLDDLLKGE